MSGERVYPSIPSMPPDPAHDAFYRSTILRVIDEVFTDARIEYGPLPSDLRSAHEHYRVGAFDALTDLHEALRARFEEADDE